MSRATFEGRNSACGSAHLWQLIMSDHASRSQHRKPGRLSVRALPTQFSLTY